MQTIDDLRQFFDDNSWRWPFHATPAIREQGLLLGNGSVLARMGRYRRGVDLLALPQDEERLLVLLTAVCGRQISPRVMHYVSRASEQWRRGDKVMAQIELAFARFPRLETSEDAFRLFLAEDLLAKGVTPRRLTRELGFDPRLLKYDPNEPRNPAGDGRPSGRWVKIGDGAADQYAWSARAEDALAIAIRGGSLLGEASPEVIAWLAAFATGATIAVGATLFFGLLLFPTPNPGGVYEGDVPGLPGIRYRLLGPEGRVEVTATSGNGQKVTVEGSRSPAGLYVDRRGRTLGRSVDGGTFLELDAVTAALREKLGADQRDEPALGAELALHSDEPRLCPKPSKDSGGKKEFDKLYQEYVGTIVNPQVQPPLPAELGFALFNPISGQNVLFDHCRLSNGDMIDAKGHYEDMLSSDFGRDRLTEEWTKQANRQIQAAAANGGRRVEWHFYEQESLEFARNVFAKAGILEKVTLVYTDYPGTPEWPYPESARWARGRQKR